MGKTRNLLEGLPVKEAVVDEMVVDEMDNKSRKRKRKTTKKSISKIKFPFWESELNWQNVIPSDSLSLLVGSEEGGFLSLEEIDGDTWQIPKSEVRDENNTVEVADLDNITSPALSSKGQKRKKKTAEDQSVATTPIFLHGNNRPEGNSIELAVADTKTVKQQLKKRKKKAREKMKVEKTKQRKEDPAPNCSDILRNLKFCDVSTVVEDMKETSLLQVGLREGKKPKPGSRARKLLRGKHGGQVNVAMNSADNEATPVSDKELMDMSAWAEMRLHPLLEKAMSELKFREPTPIQKQCIPAAAHKGKDVIGAAETGSGKTLAFGLPILQRLLEEQDKASQKVFLKNGRDDAEVEVRKTVREELLRALIITPTRELALQICDHLKAAAKWTTIRVVPIVGGMATQKQQRLLKMRPEIVVGTPGRLWELMSGGENHLLELQFLSFFVLDEADRMVEKGHFKELQSIIDMLRSTQSKDSGEDNGNTELMDDIVGEVVDLPKPSKRRQTLVFSATLALPADFKSKLKRGHQTPKAVFKSVESVAALSERAGMSHNAAIIDLTSSNIVAKKLRESILECRDEDKDQYLYYILKVLGVGRTLVFCTSVAALRRASAILRLLEIPVWPLHAQMQQKARLKAMDRFRGNEDCVLVATDVAARGLDVPGIRTVVHYQLPHSAEIYVHRSGRTARASTDGISIALVSPADRAKYFTLCRALSRPEGFQPFPVNMTYLPAIEERVSLAVKLDKLARKQSQTKASDAWLARNAEAMEIDMEDSEDEDGVTNTGKNGSTLTKRDSSQLRVLQKELQELLSQPVKPKAFSNRYITGVSTALTFFPAGMTPLVTKQLHDYMLAKSDCHGAATATKKGKLDVIGQEKMEPLEALRISASLPQVKRKLH